MNRAQDKDGWEQAPDERTGLWVYVVGGCLALLVLSYVPLALVYVEHFLFGTTKTGEFFVSLGLDSALSKLYGATLGWLFP